MKFPFVQIELSPCNVSYSCKNPCLVSEAPFGNPHDIARQEQIPVAKK